MPDETVNKVTAFVTRGEGTERELLVFRHPRAGIQLPAGTVERGEAIEAAVLREVAEETGLTQLTIVARLDTLPEPLGLDGCMVTTRDRLRAAPWETAPFVELAIDHATISWLGRGLKVRRIRDEVGYVVQAGYAQVGYDLYDIRGSHDWVLRETMVGWLPLQTLTTDVRRHLFHLRLTAPADDRLLFNSDVPASVLYWVPLTEDPGLVRGHDVLLAGVLERLR
jgi:8-oxo-dGTP pyrophosphatase MutT (NUDIX family)